MARKHYRAVKREIDSRNFHRDILTEWIADQQSSQLRHQVREMIKHHNLKKSINEFNKKMVNYIDETAKTCKIHAVMYTLICFAIVLVLFIGMIAAFGGSN